MMSTMLILHDFSVFGHSALPILGTTMKATSFILTLYSEQSLNWESYEQVSAWQLFNSEFSSMDESLDSFVPPLISKIDLGTSLHCLEFSLILFMQLITKRCRDCFSSCELTHLLPQFCSRSSPNAKLITTSYQARKQMIGCCSWYVFWRDGPPDMDHKSVRYWSKS